MGDSTPQTPAGWYPDPQDPSQLRYWDGQAWTEHRSPLPPSPGATPQSSPGESSGLAPTTAATAVAGEPATKSKNWFARHKIITTTVVVFAVLIIAAAIGGNGGSSSTSAASSGTATAPVNTSAPAAPSAAATSKAPATTKAAPAPGLKTPVRDGKFQFVVNSVKTGVATIGDSGFDMKAQGQFVLISVSVTNIGNESQLFDASNQVLLDASGKQYSASSEAAIYLPSAQQAFLEDINPGNSVTGTLVYDVPKTMVPAAIELHDSMFSGGVTVRLR